MAIHRLLGAYGLLLALSLATAGHASPQVAGVRTVGQGDFGTYWAARGAGLHESFGITQGYLEMQNVWTVPLENAVFYVEYFDNQGRFCFSLIFSQEKNVPDKGPISPGGSRILYANAVGLSPASEPTDAKLYLIRQTVVGQSNVLKWNVPTRAPAELGGSVSVDNSKVRLNLPATNQPSIDVLFANLALDQRGVVTRVDIFQSLGSDLTSWFRDFVGQQTFYPPVRNDLPTGGEALVLVRAVLSDEGLRSSPSEPRLSPWVKAYAAKVKDDLPPVTQFILRRPPTEVKRGESVTHLSPSPPGLFELNLVVDWSEPAVNWINDLAAPHGLKREF